MPTDAEAVENLGNCPGARCRGQDDFRTAACDERGGRVFSTCIHIVTGAQLEGESALVSTACDRHGFESHSAGELYGEVSKTADPLDRNQIARLRRAVAQGVERGSAGAEQWSGLNVRHALRHAGERFRRCKHVVRVAAIVRDAADPFLATRDEVARAAGITHKAVTAVPADAYAVAILPAADTVTHANDHPGDFMARHTWELQAGERARLHEEVTVADSTGANPDEHFVRRRSRYRPGAENERSIRSSNVRGT